MAAVDEQEGLQVPGQQQGAFINSMLSASVT